MMEIQNNKQEQQKPLILCDVDGVLLDWCAGFDKWMKETGFPLYETVVGCPLRDKYRISEDALCFLIEVFNSTEHFSDLPVLADAAEYLKKLKEEGYEIVLITSMGSKKESEGYRITNLTKHFGAGCYAKLHCLPLRTSKHSILSEYNDSEREIWWIEDSIENALDGVKLGYKTILIAHDYNQQEHHKDKYKGKQLTVVENWKQAYQTITNKDTYQNVHQH